MQPNTIKPIEQNQRTAIVDILRGWALLGVVMMNYIDFASFESSTTKPHHTDLGSTITYYIMNILFAAKSWTLLSLLFGYGFAVLINNLQKKGYNAPKFFAKRMFWLFVLAFINCALFFGDILKDYAFIGLLMILFYRISGKAALISALILIALIPFMYPLLTKLWPYDYSKAVDSLMPLYHSRLPGTFAFNLKGTWLLEVIFPLYLIPVHLTQLACMLLGLSAYRYNIFNRLIDYKKYIKRTWLITLCAGTLLTVLGIVSWKYKFTYRNYVNLSTITVLCTMLFIASSVCLLYMAGKLKKFFASLSFFGKMTLTNYMTQNVISLFLFTGAGLGIYSSLHPAVYVGIGIGVYILQVFFSKWWLANYNYGPVEWLWRQLSYGKRLPIKKGKAQPAAILQQA